jgi:Na+/H+ antiporter NhaC
VGFANLAIANNTVSIVIQGQLPKKLMMNMTLIQENVILDFFLRYTDVSQYGYKYY